MTGIAGFFGTLIDLLTVVVGFGLIVFIHELGHFLAARWAGIRVLGFALGFGPAIVSYRRGFGFQRGSSEDRYRDLLRRESEGTSDAKPVAVSPTEYRFNALPLGGYVKMLGQEDLNPEATSAAPDSYQMTPPWKRMVVISAGVIMNLISAVILFIVVFMIGRDVPPPTIGLVASNSPAATTAASNAEDLGVGAPGLRPGDRVVSINGELPRHFDAISLAVAMTSRGAPVDLEVERAGSEDTLRFSIRPEADPRSGLLSVGIGPSVSTTLAKVKESELAAWSRLAESAGIAGIESGSRLVQAGDRADITEALQIVEVFEASEGRPVALTFESPTGQRTTLEVEPRAEFIASFVARTTGEVASLEHLLGLMPLMTVEDAGTEQDRARHGLRSGDAFLRIGAVEFPSLLAGTDEVRASAGQPIAIEVRRDGAEVTLEPPVRRDRTVGFTPGDTRADAAALGTPLRTVRDSIDGEPRRVAAARLPLSGGETILAVNGTAVSTLVGARDALIEATRDELAAASSATVTLELRGPEGGTGEADWTLEPADLERLHALGWTAPAELLALFEPAEISLRASGPVQAVEFGLQDTRDALIKTYITFARLFEGTVKIEHLKGPVGIAHVGTLIASRGPIWLMWFFALLSVNLAVINFLPLPIVDGGQFLMLVYEQFRGKPVPMQVQGAVTMAGLLLIGTLFIVITFNDVRNLLGL
ncbi:MAG: site-2 protease family protein [Planctomycetota bacterium]